MSATATATSCSTTPRTGRRRLGGRVGASGVSGVRPGTLDRTFGGDGRVTTAFGEDVAVAEGLAVQADGKLVAASRLVAADRSGVDFAVARYRRDGRLDTGFRNRWEGDHRHRVE